MEHDMKDGFPMLFVRDGAVLANSRTVAEAFGKKNEHVNEAIDNLLKTKVIENPVALFREVNAFHEGANRVVRSFEMTRDGFTLLAMGFTGEKALRWKLKYIEAFNRMEAELRGGGVDPAMIAALIEATKENAIALRDFGAHLRSQDEQLRDLKRRLDAADAERDAAIMRDIAEEAFRRDDHVSAVTHLSVYDLLNGTKRSESAGFFDLRVARKGRGNGISLVRRSLQTYFDQHGHAGDRLQPPRESRHEGALFSIRLIAEWLANGGGRLIVSLQRKQPFARRSQSDSQTVLPFPKPGAR
jgi:Rha family phage regulatory protein